jgi:two-component system response regulator YesN
MRKMIIADDERSALDLLDKVLDWESLGIEICGKLENGREALDKIREAQPDILLTDIRMPEMDGMELLDQLYGERHRTETIIISAYSDFEYAQKALSYGIAGYLLKPVNEEQLLKVVMKALDSLEKRERQENTFRLSLSIAENRILKDLLSPSEDARRLIATLDELGCEVPDGEYCLAAVDVRYDSYGDMESFASGPEGGIPSEVARLCESWGINHPLVFENTAEEWLVLIEGTKERSIGQIILNLKDRREAENTLRLSSIHSGLDELYKAYAETTATENIDKEAGLQKSPLVTKAVAYIEKNYMKDVNLEEICSNSSVSKTYFCGLFKREMGTGIWDFLTECRIRRAEDLIRENILRNYEIAFEIGYENPGYFSKMFKRITGVTPSQYRKELKQGS